MREVEIKEIDVEWLKKYCRFSGDTLRHKRGTEEYIKLSYSLIMNGLTDSISLGIKNNRPYIANGNHRLQILDELGYKRLPVKIFSEDDIKDVQNQ